MQQEPDQKPSALWPGSIILFSFFLLVCAIAGLSITLDAKFSSQQHALHTWIFHPFIVFILSSVSLYLVVSRRQHARTVSVAQLVFLGLAGASALAVGGKMPGDQVRMYVGMVFLAIFFLFVVWSRSASIFFQAADTIDELISDGEVQWIMQGLQWLQKNFPDNSSQGTRNLVLPTPEYFPGLKIPHEKNVASIFEKVRQYAGMQDWPCVLQYQEDDPEAAVSGTVMIENAPQGPAGTFQTHEGEAIITFNPGIANDMPALVATFAHELSHYKLLALDNGLPVEGDEEELLTDLMAVYMGFGIFLANNKFSFQQVQDGFYRAWGARTQGYLSENQLLFALAAYTRQATQDPEQVIKHLKDSLKSRYRKMLALLTDNPELSERLAEQVVS